MTSVSAEQRERKSHRWEIDAVRSELTEKVLAYNFCRAIEIRARKQENLQRTG